MRLPHILAVIMALIAIAGLIVFLLPKNIRTTTPSNLPSDFPADFSFELVSTPEDQVRGLSGRAEVPHGYGMLFVFDAVGRYDFWMKDMLVPIDILWLSEEGVVVGIEKNVSPETFPETFSPPIPIRYVLEMRAGESDVLGLRNGSRIPLPI